MTNIHGECACAGLSPGRCSFNKPVALAMYENIKHVGLPQWSEADQAAGEGRPEGVEGGRARPGSESSSLSGVARERRPADARRFRRYR